MGPNTLTWNINNTVVNESYYPENFSCITTDKTLDFLTINIAVVGLAGNAIVLWLLAFHIHRNAFSTYVFNLAGADFLYLCSHIVFFLKCVLQLNNSFFYFLIIVYMFSYLAGLCMIAAISVERCLSVMWPIWYRCQRPRHTSAIMCALLWVFCLLLSLLEGGGCGLLFSDREYYFCTTIEVIITVFVIVLSIVPSVLNLALLVKIVCGSHRIPLTRFYVTITLTVVVFLFFGLPFGIYFFLFRWIITFKVENYNVYKVIICLSCVNSCANPIIYFLVGSIRHRRLERQTLKLFLQRAMQDTPEEESRKSGSSQVWETGNNLVQ